MQTSGISRATLHNYVALGLLPKPLVRNPDDNSNTRARQLGYFPQDAIDRIERIKHMKKEGLTMADIFRQLSREEVDGSRIQATAAPRSERHRDDRSAAADTMPPMMQKTSRTMTSETGPLRVTIDKLHYPAYMLNYNLEISWYNEEARVSVLGSFDNLPADTKERYVLDYFSRSVYGRSLENFEAFRQMHQQMGRERLPAVRTDAGRDASESASRSIAEWKLDLLSPEGKTEHYRVYASYFREGILVIYTSDTSREEDLLGMLSQRDDVIRDLLKKRLPVLTDVAVIVADLQNSVRICSELPPEEYFELINQIWATMEPIFRSYYGTHGKHVGDGMVYYFFPQPDSNYAFNALRCAIQLREAMRKISKEWQIRKNWLNDLYLNTGLHEGQEWVGIFHIQTKIEFTVLGDTINHGARLSDFARHGSLWASKTLMGKLTPEERKKIRFGVKRQGRDDHEVFVQDSYSRLSELVDLSSARYEKLRDISTMAVTEIIEVQ